MAGRVVAFVEQFDFARERLVGRMAGPAFDSGNGTPVEVPAMRDEEYLWEPVADCWSIRPRAGGPGPGATDLVGAGDWGRDSAYPAPWPPPVTTIAWRLGHLSEMLALRADHTVGGHSLTREDYAFYGDVAGGIAAFEQGASAWRAALVSADDAALDQVGRSGYPYGSDPQDRFIDTVWWVNQELLHHGAEIALLRDLYRARLALASAGSGRDQFILGDRPARHQRSPVAMLSAYKTARSVVLRSHVINLCIHTGRSTGRSGYVQAVLSKF